MILHEQGFAFVFRSAMGGMGKVKCYLDWCDDANAMLLWIITVYKEIKRVHVWALFVFVCVGAIVFVSAPL